MRTCGASRDLHSGEHARAVRCAPFLSISDEKGLLLHGHCRSVSRRRDNAMIWGKSAK
jgi:hypothetical protein